MNSWTETATVSFFGLFLVHDLAKISGGSITNPEVNRLTPHPEGSQGTELATQVIKPVPKKKV